MACSVTEFERALVGSPILDASMVIIEQPRLLSTNQSAEFTYNYVRVAAENNSRVSFGSNPTADQDSEYLHAGGVIERYVIPGHKVSVLDV